MPREPAPWYRKARRMWFAQLAGRQVPLSGPVPDSPESHAAALEVLRQLLAATNPPAAKPVRTVRDAAVEFLAARRPRISAACYRQYRITLEVHLCPAFGGRGVDTLTADELERWADRPGWSNSTRNNNLGSVQTFLKWCGHPLPLRRPPKESRGADTVLSDEQFGAVLAAYDSSYGGDLAELLRALRLTGARPQELARLTVEQVDWGNALARLREHKTARHKAERVIHFSEAALVILTAQRRRHRTGYLFRTRNGNPYRPEQIVKQMRRLSARVGFRAIAYGQRHSFATQALCAGVNDTVVAALLGHASTSMVHRHYSHVGENARAMRDALNKISRGEVA